MRIGARCDDTNTFPPKAPPVRRCPPLPADTDQPGASSGLTGCIAESESVCPNFPAPSPRRALAEALFALEEEAGRPPILLALYRQRVPLPVWRASPVCSASSCPRTSTGARLFRRRDRRAAHRVSARDANPAPATNRIKSPKLHAAGAPTKCNPGTELWKPRSNHPDAAGCTQGLARGASCNRPGLLGMSAAQSAFRNKP